jgi:hypothetical protein
VQHQLEVFVKATRKAGITNLMVIALDERLAEWCKSNGVAYWLRQDGAKGSHKISAQKFKFIKDVIRRAAVDPTSRAALDPIWAAIPAPLGLHAQTARARQSSSATHRSIPLSSPLCRFCPWEPLSW